MDVIGYAFVTLNSDGYRATIRTASGKAFAHELAFQDVAEAKALARRVSGAGKVDAARWFEIAL